MDPTPESLTMNSTTSTVSDLTLQTMQQQMQLMQQMTDKMSTIQCQPIGTTQQSSTRQHPTTNQQNLNQQLYCWRHGAYNHSSKDCRDKGECHQDDTTFEIYMGRSTKNMIDA